MSDTDKRCSKCKEHKPSSEFYKSSPQPDGRDAYCKVCRKEANAAYRRKRPEYNSRWWHERGKHLREARKAEKPLEASNKYHPSQHTQS